MSDINPRAILLILIAALVGAQLGSLLLGLLAGCVIVFIASMAT